MFGGWEREREGEEKYEVFLVPGRRLRCSTEYNEYTTHDTRPVRFEVFIVFIPCVSGIVVVLLLLLLVFLFLFLIDWFSFTHNHSTHSLTSYYTSSFFFQSPSGGRKEGPSSFFFHFLFLFPFPLGFDSS